MGLSEFLQHVTSGSVAAFDADSAIPEGEEEGLDEGSDAGASDAEVALDGVEDGAQGGGGDEADAFPGGLLTALAEAGGPSQSSPSQVHMIQHR